MPRRRGSRSRQLKWSNLVCPTTNRSGPNGVSCRTATRSAVTELMVQLLSEHRRSERLYVAGERSDD